MSDIMRQIPFNKMIEWVLEEYNNYGRIFGVSKEKFYKNNSGKVLDIFGEKISSAIGPAAGPNSQLTQNIVASYLAGSRLIELKTVQIMDGEALRKCVAKPCINAEDECYNVEWSTELTVEEAFDEYVKAHFAILFLAKELGLSDTKDFAFNMSVGYDLEGIKSDKINNFIEGLKDASNSNVYNECKKYLLDNVSKFKNVDAKFVESITNKVCTSITISTLHGCPPAEIDRIARYLLTEKKLHTYIKCNPTLLGYEFARKTLDKMGYDYVAFDDHHFLDDLQYSDAVKMLKELKVLASELGFEFGVKITNTFPVDITNKELPGEEMYMSGRSLYPLSLSVANMLTRDFNGELPISYSGGADFFNIEELIATGIRPITFATTVLKPGGYERITQLASICEKYLDGKVKNIDVEKLNNLATNVVNNKFHVKDFRPVGSRKTDSILPLYDCFKAPCKDGGCPISQQIPEYLALVHDEKYDEAFKVIAIDNANPAITGTICDHNCQKKCTRLDYEKCLKIRDSKLIAVINAQDKFIENIKVAGLNTTKKVVVIGAGPAGVSTALFLRRNGVSVTVLEKNERPFGIVEYVIPEFRISKDLIQKDYQLAVKTGVEFKFNVKDFDVSELKKEYDFIVIATGAWDKCPSPVKDGNGEFLDALELLSESKKSNLSVNLGKKVAIIGGGDVAMDCARTAARTKGVEKAVIVYRRTQTYMPAEAEEISLAKKDGVEFIELVAPVSFDGKTLVCEKMKLAERDASGRRSVVGTSEKVSMEFDTVVAATGAKVNTSVFEKFGVALDGRKNPSINDENETSVENVYIAGDCKRGPSTVVRGIADGKNIALSILKKLSLDNDFVRVERESNEQTLYNKKGVLVDASETGTADGDRCLGCDKLCELCCDVCPNRANVTVGNHKIVHIDGMCNECGNCGVFCPHTGNPYKDKITIFWTEEDFVESTNKGFLKLNEKEFKVRNESGEVLIHTLGDGKITPMMKEILEVVIEKHSYYLSIN